MKRARTNYKYGNTIPIGCLIFLLCLAFAKQGYTVEAKKPQEHKPVDIIRLYPNEPMEYTRLIEEKARFYGADPAKMRATIECETAGTWDTTIQSYARYKGGTREKSYGLSQIHLPAHPHVSHKEATTPEYAITFMAQHFGENNAQIWSCYKQMFGSQPSTI